MKHSNITSFIIIFILNFSEYNYGLFFLILCYFKFLYSWGSWQTLNCNEITNRANCKHLESLKTEEVSPDDDFLNAVIQSYWEKDKTSEYLSKKIESEVNSQIFDELHDNKLYKIFNLAFNIDRLLIGDEPPRISRTFMALDKEQGYQMKCNIFYRNPKDFIQFTIAKLFTFTCTNINIHGKLLANIRNLQTDVPHFRRLILQFSTQPCIHLNVHIKFQFLFINLDLSAIKYLLYDKIIEFLEQKALLLIPGLKQGFTQTIEIKRYFVSRI